jgi:hypothetical protein
MQVPSVLECLLLDFINQPGRIRACDQMDNGSVPVRYQYGKF